MTTIAETLTRRYCDALRETDEPVVHAVAMVEAIQHLFDDLRRDDHDPTVDVSLRLAESSAQTLVEALRDLLAGE